MPTCLAGDVPAGLYPPSHQGYRCTQCNGEAAYPKKRCNGLKRILSITPNRLNNRNWDPIDSGSEITVPVVDLNGPEIVVLRVGHRREIYKR